MQLLIHVIIFVCMRDPEVYVCNNYLMVSMRISHIIYLPSQALVLITAFTSKCLTGSTAAIVSIKSLEYSSWSHISKKLIRSTPRYRCRRSICGANTWFNVKTFDRRNVNAIFVFLLPCVGIYAYTCNPPRIRPRRLLVLIMILKQFFFK